MKIDIKKTVQYRYIQYRFKKWCLKNEEIKKLSQEDKDKICIEATKKTRGFTLIYSPFYIAVMLIFHFSFIMNIEYNNNVFVIWYRGVIESVIPLINGDWGDTRIQKMGTFLLIYIKLIPVGIIYAIPMFIPIFVMANRNLQKTAIRQTACHACKIHDAMLK